MSEAELVRAATRAQRWDDLLELSNRYFGRVCLIDPLAWAEAFAAVPPEWFDEYPRQRYLAGMVRSLAGNFTVVDSANVQRMRDWIASQEAPLARDLLGEALGRLQFLRVLGRFSEAAAVADEMEQTIASTTEFTDFDDILPSVLIPVGTTRLMVGDIAGAVSAFSEAERWCRVGPQHPALPHTRNYRALAYALDGDFGLARTTMTAGAGTRSEPNGTLAHIYENASVFLPAILGLAAFDEDAAGRALDLIDEDAETDEFWWLATLVRARYALYWGNPEHGATTIRHALLTQQKLSGPGTLALTLLTATLSDLLQALGDLAAAADALHTDGIDQQHPAVRASLARLRSDPALLQRRQGAIGSRGAVAEAIIANLTDRSGNRRETIDATDRAVRAIQRAEHYAALMELDPGLRRDLIQRLGSAQVSPDLQIWAAHGHIALSPREREILIALAHGTPVKLIAQQTFLSANTVKTHVRALYSKLHATSREEAIRNARSLGLLAAPPARSIPPGPAGQSAQR